LFPKGEHGVVALDERGQVDEAMLAHGEERYLVRLAGSDQGVHEGFFVLRMNVVVIG
jgi:hypothetical protein